MITKFGMTAFNGLAGAVGISEIVAEFHNCTFQNNVCAQQGGGLYIESSVITLDNCVITRNNASSGSGIRLYESNVTFIRSSIYQNSFGSDITCVGTNGWTFDPSSVSTVNPCAEFQCEFRDVCSVCNGNSSCVSGCDSKPWSTGTSDVCGVCKGKTF